ncbi:uncharacterized protein [Gossypium hirsutum]|uniref:Integrase catalytic domain-containing protein n=1 Tax=Gossypium hirsutum TaxID=3635 RepID=A0A1U8JLA0_GOSHI|nr:uncharacterized protein LOC107906844 [Gossypium hirsutum]
MKEEETVKQYLDRIMVVVNSIRLLCKQFNEVRIVDKVISTLPERYKAKISSLEDLRELTSISLTELINALYTQEQRRASRLEEHQESDFQAKTNSASTNTAYKVKKAWIDKPKFDSGKRRDQPSPQEKLTNGWLLDSGCTNHMTPDATIFKSSDRSCKTKFKIRNGHFIKAECKGDVLICTPTVFKGKECQISDPSGSKLMAVTMADKSFVIDWTNGSETAHTATSDESKLWHQRLGHANYRSMDQLSRDDLAENFIGSVQKQEFCEALNISSQTPTPQQNGVSERKNRSLMDMAKCSMIEKNLPKTLWAEVVNTAAYIQNRIPTKALAQKTPFDA